ncbi:MAG: hypothetical protein JXB25_04205 [Deltaproteobacteria bacterium]|nr:hypothetical protein [Deltaproteobacteria bacterium]
MLKSWSAVVFGLLLVLVAGSPVSGAESERFHRQSVIDQQGFGMEAFCLLVPHGWRFQGGVSWDTRKFPAEASIGYQVSSPDSRSWFEQYPHRTFFWSQDPNLQASYAQGGAEIAQPMDAVSYLRNVFLPRYRSGVSQVQVLESGPLPELAQETYAIVSYHMGIFGQISPFTFPYELRADAGHIKIEYQLQGQRMVEELTATVSFMIAYFQGMYGQIPAITWIPNVKAFRAPRERMEDEARLFKIMMGSYRENPNWAVAGTRLAATITREQLRQQQAIFNRMQQIRRTQSEVDDMIMDSYQRRSAAQDRIFDNYSEAIRGVDSYRDPVNDWKVELPTGMNNAWTNGSDYVFSERSDFNPNIGGNQNWQRMERQQ